MALSWKDPHVQLGIEHAREGRKRETGWTDPELQRRYDMGFICGRYTAPDRVMTFAELDQLMDELGYNRTR
jgi:hypothetical protein